LRSRIAVLCDAAQPFDGLSIIAWRTYAIPIHLTEGELCRSITLLSVLAHLLQRACPKRGGKRAQKNNKNSKRNLFHSLLSPDEVVTYTHSTRAKFVFFAKLLSSCLRSPVPLRIDSLAEAKILPEAKFSE
jgi:hypothetical protein